MARPSLAGSSGWELASNIRATPALDVLRWQQVYQGRKSWWALSRTPVVAFRLRNAYFAERSLIFLADLHRRARQHIAAPVSPQLALWG